MESGGLGLGRWFGWEREGTRECTSRSPYWVRAGQIECTRFIVEIGEYLKVDLEASSIIARILGEVGNRFAL